MTFSIGQTGYEVIAAELERREDICFLYTSCLPQEEVRQHAYGFLLDCYKQILRTSKEPNDAALDSIHEHVISMCSENMSSNVEQEPSSSSAAANHREEHKHRKQMKREWNEAIKLTSRFKDVFSNPTIPRAMDAAKKQAEDILYRNGQHELQVHLMPSAQVDMCPFRIMINDNLPSFLTLKWIKGLAHRRACFESLVSPNMDRKVESSETRSKAQRVEDTFKVYGPRQSIFDFWETRKGKHKEGVLEVDGTANGMDLEMERQRQLPLHPLDVRLYTKLKTLKPMLRSLTPDSQARLPCRYISANISPAGCVVPTHYETISVPYVMAGIEGTKVVFAWPPTHENVQYLRQAHNLVGPYETPLLHYINNMEQMTFNILKPGRLVVVPPGWSFAMLALTSSFHIGWEYYPASGPDLEAAKILAEQLADIDRTLGKNGEATIQDAHYGYIYDASVELEEWLDHATPEQKTLIEKVYDLIPSFLPPE